MVYAALQHAAAVPVRRNLDAVRRDGVVDELGNTSISGFDFKLHS